MAILVGYDFWADNVFEDESLSLRNVKYTEFSNMIIDEISVRQKTDQGMANIHEEWQNDSYILAKFLNSLEAGNIANNGLKIVKFKIYRKLVNQELNDNTYLGDVPYNGDLNNYDLEFIDSTQPNSKLIYTVIPVGENDLDGVPKEVECESTFTGYWIVDKDTNEVLSFDKSIGTMGNVDTTFTQNRTVIETFSKYPQVYYSNPDGGYHSFTLTATFLPEDWQRSGDVYSNILNGFIKQNKAFLVKADNGSLYLVDLSNIRTSAPINTWKEFDYTTISIDCMEIMDFEDFLYKY